MALAVVESTAQWAAARGVPAWPALRAAVPTPRDFARAAAQEALCAADLVRSLPKAEQASLAAGVARSRVIAHEQVGRLQGVDTFEALRAATEPGPEGTQPEEILGHTLMVNQAAHLARFERTARKVTALLAQTPTGG